MMLCSTSGAKLLMSVEAIIAFCWRRPQISPAMRWEKNSIGRRSTCHMYSLLPTTAILPLALRE